MIDLVLIIFCIIFLLLVFIYPKLIKVFLIGVIGYFAVFVNWYYGALFIPLLIIILIYKKRREKN